MTMQSAIVLAYLRARISQEALERAAEYRDASHAYFTVAMKLGGLA